MHLKLTTENQKRSQHVTGCSSWVLTDHAQKSPRTLVSPLLAASNADSEPAGTNEEEAPVEIIQHRSQTMAGRTHSRMRGQG